MIAPPPPMVLVLLESPYAGYVERNLAYARACMRDCLLRGEAPFASHLLYAANLIGPEQPVTVPLTRGFSTVVDEADAERVLVARVPGLLPLRPEVPVPVGVEPAGNLAALPLDWDRLAAEKAELTPRLERWPGPR